MEDYFFEIFGGYDVKIVIIKLLLIDILLNWLFSVLVELNKIFGFVCNWIKRNIEKFVCE